MLMWMFAKSRIANNFLWVLKYIPENMVNTYAWIRIKREILNLKSVISRFWLRLGSPTFSDQRCKQIKTMANNFMTRRHQLESVADPEGPLPGGA